MNYGFRGWVRSARQSKADARLILCGDPSQHRGVEAGDTLTLLTQEAGLVPAELTAIRRQSGIYRQAVTALSQGRIPEAFRHLDAIGAIKEIKTDDRYQALADDYVQSIQNGKTTLVVSPTHAEADKASEAIRRKLRDAGRLGKDERAFDVLVNRNLTLAERADRSRLDRVTSSCSTRTPPAESKKVSDGWLGGTSCRSIRPIGMPSTSRAELNCPKETRSG